MQWIKLKWITPRCKRKVVEIKEDFEISDEEWEEDDAELKAKYPKNYAKWGIK